VTGVQQELMPPTAASAQGDLMTSMTHQVPAAMRPTGNSGAEAALQLGLQHAEAFIGTCPDCGSQMEYAEGCVKCHVCGFSECG
jgi:ribonucleoside-diphosphate reductase alpha chain